jgi:hypothetical protein
MTLYPQAAQDLGPIPSETARVARAAFPQGNVYLRMRDEVGVLYADQTFAPLFSTRGRPAEAPWRLALVSVPQYVEGLSDRQAAEAIRGRIDWKYALGLELTNAGFDASVLSEFSRGEDLAARSSSCLIPCSNASVSASGSKHGGISARTRPMCWRRSAPSTAWKAWGRRCAIPSMCCC